MRWDLFGDHKTSPCRVGSRKRKRRAHRRRARGGIPVAVMCLSASLFSIFSTSILTSSPCSRKQQQQRGRMACPRLSRAATLPLKGGGKGSLGHVRGSISCLFMQKNKTEIAVLVKLKLLNIRQSIVMLCRTKQ